MYLSMQKGTINKNKNFNKHKIDFEKFNEKSSTIEESNVIERKRFQTARAQPFSMKTHVLDYVFKFHRQKLQSCKFDKAKLEDYIYDLENTWSINTDILTTMLIENSGGEYTIENKAQLCIIIDKIKDLVLKKKSLRENKMKLRSKLLMDKQIMEENKRRNEENMAYYAEQLDEFKENLDKKDSFIKQFIKKFSEVEIYIQREAKNLPVRWSHFIAFEIVDFIDRNGARQKRKLAIVEDIHSIREDMDAILRENVELKKRDEYIDISVENEDQNAKYVTLINNYESKIKYFERNNESLKNILNNLTAKFEYGNTVSEFKNNKPLGSHKRNFTLSVPRHKKINSKAENLFRDLNLNNENNGGNPSDKIMEDVGENNEEIMYGNEIEQEGEDGNNKSILDLENKKFSIINNEHSIFNQKAFNHKITQGNTLNKAQWDISCIENL